MSKKLIFIAALTLLLGYCANSAWNQHQKDLAREAKERAMTEEANQAIADSIQRNNANYKWIEVIGKDATRDRILTIELENLWPPGTPIFFPGSIDDVVRKDGSTYTVFVKRNLALMLMHIPEIELNLDCDKDQIDDFLSKNRDLFDDAGFKNNVVVIADIKSVRQTDDHIAVGYGKCVELLRDPVEMQNRLDFSTYKLK